ncbi:MAG: aminoglycoside phosphotransferase, partial [Verrucomicrobiae bacterium]|nr:aminoglycoside phosphotransferase [Verrucomicrobiae bacterium]
MNILHEVTSQFQGKGDVREIKPLGKGHINDSYRVVMGEQAYVLQRINHHIFKNVEQLQQNISRVTGHIRKKLEGKGVPDVDSRVLTLVPTLEGALFHRDGNGDYWRMMLFIAESKSYDEINPVLAQRAGEAFGAFQLMLADLPGEPLFETIPDFHNMEVRLQSFRESVEADRAGRLNEVASLVDEIESRADEMCKAERMHREEILPKRTNHCDTKV